MKILKVILGIITVSLLFATLIVIIYAIGALVHKLGYFTNSFSFDVGLAFISAIAISSIIIMLGIYISREL